MGKVVYDPINQDAIVFLVLHRRVSKNDMLKNLVGEDWVPSPWWFILITRSIFERRDKYENMAV